MSYFIRATYCRNFSVLFISLSGELVRPTMNLHIYIYGMEMGAVDIGGGGRGANYVVMVSYLINMFEQCASYRSP
jgi:hypothetical protein